MKSRQVILSFSAVIALAICASVLIRTQRIKAAQPCWLTLVNIDGAKEEWAVATQTASGTSVTLSNILPYMSKPPTCRIAGAIYIIGKVGEEPRCTVHGTASHFKPDRY
jgi:hypothetical protein